MEIFFFYKRISNYIKTCSTTPNTSKFARVKGRAKKHKCSILFDLVFISRPVVWSHAMLHLCFLAQPFTLANLLVFGVVLQVLI